MNHSYFISLVVTTCNISEYWYIHQFVTTVTYSPQTLAIILSIVNIILFLANETTYFDVAIDHGEAIGTSIHSTRSHCSRLQKVIIIYSSHVATSVNI